MLIKILPVASSESAVESQILKKEAEVASGEAAAKEQKRLKQLEEAKKKLEAVKASRCWEFFKGQNPRNVTACSECHYKAMGGNDHPCWIVVGEVEGITFEYVNEDCFECEFYEKHHPDDDVIEL